MKFWQRGVAIALLAWLGGVCFAQVGQKVAASTWTLSNAIESLVAIFLLMLVAFLAGRESKQEG